METNKSEEVKPILGVLRRHVYESILLDQYALFGGMSEVMVWRERKERIGAAIVRFTLAGKEINEEWIMEYNELTHKIEKYENGMY